VGGRVEGWENNRIAAARSVGCLLVLAGRRNSSLRQLCIVLPRDSVKRTDSSWSFGWFARRVGRMSTWLRLVYGLIAGLFLAVFMFGAQMALLYTDWIWFDTLQFSDVFKTTYLARMGLGLASGLFCLVFIAANIRVSLRAPDREPIQLLFPSEIDESPVGGLLRRLPPSGPFLAIGAFVSFIVALVGSASWENVLLYLNGSEFGFSEPILGYEASFYVFSLPVYEGLRAYLLTVAVVSLGVVLLSYFARGAIELDFVQVQPGQYMVQGVRVEPAARLHVAGLALIVFVLMGAGAILRRFSLLYTQDGLFAGPGFSDVNAAMPFLLLEAVATVAGGLLIALGIARLQRNLGVVGAVIIGVSWLLSGVAPQAVQTLSVVPNEFAKETQYIEHHMQATRVAFGLDEVENLPLSGEAALTAEDIQANSNTIKNVRLWDHEPLLVTFGQVQEIRTYYDFLSVDNDRYMIDGELRQTMLSPRELIPSSLPSRTWVNETQTYTHGYGVTLGPVNQVTEQGLPELFVQDLPPRVLYPDDLRIDRPEIYYGEAADFPVYLRTENQEFDYPMGDENKWSKYSGKGGISIGSTLDRALVAARLGDLQLLLTNEVTAESKVLLYRNVVERARRLAPFLMYDHDPYMIIEDGRLVWVLDAYTATDHFPYSAGFRSVGNYMRNSVKVRVDAFDGDVTFYRMDSEDPILAAWANIFPSLFTPQEAMSAEMRAHIRYPQDLFRVQAQLFAIYHMEEEQIFYNREDEWEVPAVGGRRMTPYYMVMKLPGEETEEFILMLPFTPKNKPNLAAWLVARSDGEHYGRLRVYSFPKEKMIYGPKMIAARINQDDVISEKTTLWGQQGSDVVHGTLLVVPIEESLIYVQPLYLQAESGSIPELKRIIVAYENEIAMDATLEKALAKLFGETMRDGAVDVDELGREGLETVQMGWQSLSEALEFHFVAAESAAREGNWAGYGEETKNMGAVIDRLRRLASGGEKTAEEADELAPVEADKLEAAGE
jgi:uncharacterized protein